MLCPFDQSELRPVERQGVEVDYCPRCRGVWLDRGELDKLIDRTVEALGRAPAGGRPAWADGRDRDDRGDRGDRGDVHPYDRQYGRGGYDDDRRERRDRDDDDDDRRYGDRGRRKRKESWFEDLFDFG
jgi:Zn-finger nucleic acid-binding protein